LLGPSGGELLSSPVRDLRRASARRLEDLVGGRLLGATSGDEVRQRIHELLDVSEVWELFRDLQESTSAHELATVLQPPDRPPFAKLHGTVFEPALRQGARLLAAITRVYLQLLASWVGPLTALPAIPEEPLAFMRLPLPPPIKKALLGQLTADLAVVGLGSTDHNDYDHRVVEALLEMWVEGQQSFFAFLAGVAQQLGLGAQWDDDLLPAGPMDLDELVETKARADRSRERLLAEARRLNQAIHPQPQDD